MGDAMFRIFQSLVFLVAILLLAPIGTLRAEEKKPKEISKEKPAVPVGYEDAAEPTNKGAKQEISGKPKKQEADAEEKQSDLPSGYEDAPKSGTRKKKKARRRVVAPAAQQPVRDAKAIAKEKKQVEANPQIRALVAQMRQQLKPFFAVELTFAKNVCQPNPEQLKKMKARATPALEETLRSLAIQQGGQMGWGRAIRGIPKQPRDILEQFEEAADQIVAEVFPPETVAIYQAEQQHRKAFRARAGALALVAHLDTKFRFTAPQREALSDSLQEAWQRSWQRYLQFMPSNPQFFPPVPDKAIVPHLNPVQVKQWKSMQRQDIGFHWQNLRNLNQGNFRNMNQEIDWFGEPEKNAQRVGFAAGLIRGEVNIIVGEAVEADEEEQE